MCAVERGLESIIRLLLEHSADPNVHNQSIGLTATYFAASADNDAVLRLFFARKDEDRNIECESFRMGVLLYAASVGSVTVLKTLLDSPAVDAHSKDNHDRNALLVAMHHEKEDVAKVLLADGRICLNEGDIENGRPPAYAASNGWTDIVDILLESGADIEHRDDSGQTALFHATEAASNMLFEWALNSACWDNTSRSQLSWAASARSRDVLDFLFAHGAELDSRDYQGWTLCLGACSWERTQPSSCLNAGQTLDNEGRTPLLLE